MSLLCFSGVWITFLADSKGPLLTLTGHFCTISTIPKKLIKFGDQLSLSQKDVGLKHRAALLPALSTFLSPQKELNCEFSFLRREWRMARFSSDGSGAGLEGSECESHWNADVLCSLNSHSFQKEFVPPVS